MSGRGNDEIAGGKLIFPQIKIKIKHKLHKLVHIQQEGERLESA